MHGTLLVDFGENRAYSVDGPTPENKMATLQETITLEKSPAGSEETFARLERFFMANGYTIADISRVPIADDGEGAEEREGDEMTESVLFERGKEGNGWWSSDMTELFARIKASSSASGKVILRYEIEVTGQRLTEEDLGFWRREREAAAAYAAGEEDEEPEDLREGEKERAKGRWSSTLGTSIRGFFGAFVILFMLLILAQRLGFFPFR